MVEALLAAAGLMIWFHPPERLGFAPGLLLLAFLTLVTVIDLEHRLILHPVSLVGAFLGLILGFRTHGWQETFLGGFAGYVIMALLYLLGVLFVRVLSRWRGTIDEVALGFGDVNLSGITGLLLGWPGVIAGLLIAILLSGGAGMLYLLLAVARKRYRPNMVFPFGPFLVASIVYLLYFK